MAAAPWKWLDPADYLQQEGYKRQLVGFPCKFAVGASHRCFVCFVLRLKHGGAGKWLQEVLHSLFMQTFILTIGNMEICFRMSYCFINVGVAFEGWAPSNNFGQIITFCYDHSSLVACRFRHVRFKFKYPSTYTHDLLNDDLCHLVLVSSFGVNLGSCF